MKIFEDYYLGLDIGTDSIGWAATDTQYNIMKFNGKSMWGIRLFESGKTAEDRRLHRAERRRNHRKVQRIKLLQELFAEEISKIDEAFYQRLNDSKYHVEDKKIQQANTLFNDLNFSDKQYHKKYPTIYHLRKALIEEEKKFDIRLLYLAIHHIIKHRGHFLFEGENFGSISDFEQVFKSLITEINDEWELELEYQSIESIDEIKNIIKSKSLSSKEKAKKLGDLIYSNSKSAKSRQIKAILHVMAGASVNLDDLLADETLLNEEGKKIKIKFGDSKFEEIYDDLADMLDEKIYFIDKLKSIYDWGVLENLLKGKKYISQAKVEMYEKHKQDLKLLKGLVKKYVPEKYKEVFTNTDKNNNYSAYIGKGKKNNIKVKAPTKCQQEDLLKYISKIFGNYKDVDDPELKKMFTEIEKGTFLPKQVSKDNSVIPYQVHLKELKIILDNASKHYPFLNQRDESGFSVSEKIIKLFKFRIPYYVGPLNDAHKKEDISKGTCWITKKSNEPIRPWNFEKVVDIDKSAEDFIIRMTNKCTYLLGADVIPKDSLLYSEFMVLNELNNLRINGKRTDEQLKQLILEKLFYTRKKVTQKAVKQLLKIEGFGDDIEISGIDGDFKSSLTSYIDFKKILGEDFNRDMVEEIIRWIVLFGDDKKILKRRIENNFKSELDESKIKKILSLRYKGWGRLSKEFLTELHHVKKDTGEAVSIIESMRKESKNLMELLSREYDYADKIKEYNNKKSGKSEKMTYDVVDELYVSPAVKKSIWQTLRITEEIKKITKKMPKKIFIEMARGPEEKKRTKSRKDKLIELYSALKEESRDWLDELGKKTDGDLRSDRLYLYYTQMGRCMYSGEPIDLNQLFNKNIYDVDHIYPQSKVKDDSLENRVLVKKNINAEKSDVYPLPSYIREKNKGFWKMLYSKNFIGKKKYERLTRNTPFSDNELADFIARQIVETRQSTKAVAQILSKFYGDSDIVYVKAGNVSRFRQHFDLIKVRDINDYHHAKDAYLNIVVGNVYDTKFTKNPYKFVSQGQRYSLNEKALYGNDVKKGDYYAWKKDETIHKVKRIMGKNNILFTRYAYERKGQLFKVLPVRKGKGQFPLKADPRMKDINKYGGYNSVSIAYFVLVEHQSKGKTVRSIEGIPVYLSKKIEKDKAIMEKYLADEMGLKDFKVLLPKIKLNSLFKIDGCLMHLTGKTGKRLLFQHALQCVLSHENEQYIRWVKKYYERIKESKKKNKILQVAEHDRISKAENLKLYDVFLDKLENTIYSKLFSIQIDKFKKGRDVFMNLDINDQCVVLIETLSLFQCNRTLSNLSLIGGSSNAGTVLINKVISKNGVPNKEVSIINQSITGLFEREVNLLKL